MARLLPLLAAALLATGGGLLVGCAGHTYRVEDRDVPVHVWLTAPDLARAGGTLPALIYVGSQKVVEGNVTFEAGRPTVALPTAYVRAGPTQVSAVLGDGALSAAQSVEVEGESWLQVLVRGRGAALRFGENAPDPQGR